MALRASPIFSACRTELFQPRPVTLFGDSIEWIDTPRYLGVTLDTTHLVVSHRRGQDEDCSRLVMRAPNEYEVFFRSGLVSAI